MKKVDLIFVIFFVALAAQAQSIRDEDRRGFDELGPVLIDVDGDGKSDRIQPRTYQTYKRQRGKRLYPRDIRNWITFDLYGSRSGLVKAFFTYNYGTAENGGSYWVYALIPAGDIDKDGKRDLIFYAGDDTTDETVTLLNRGNRFIVRSRKVEGPDDWIKETRKNSN